MRLLLTFETSIPLLGTFRSMILWYLCFYTVMLALTGMQNNNELCYWSEGSFVLDHHRLLFAKLFHAFWGHAFPNLMIEILDSIKYGHFSLQIASAFFLELSTLNHDLSFILKVSDAICLMQGWCFWTGLKRSNTNFSLFGILYFLLLQTWADKRRTMQFS
jgi:hypothetical protein